MEIPAATFKILKKIIDPLFKAAHPDALAKADAILAKAGFVAEDYATAAAKAKTIIPVTPSKIKTLQTIQQGVKEGTAGKRIYVRDKSGDLSHVTSQGSTYPEYFQGTGWNKASTLSALRKVMAGQVITPQQKAVIETAMARARADTARELNIYRNTTPLTERIAFSKANKPVASAVKEATPHSKFRSTLPTGNTTKETQPLLDALRIPPVEPVVKEAQILAKAGAKIKDIDKHISFRTGLKSTDELLGTQEEQRLANIKTNTAQFKAEVQADTDAKLASIIKPPRPIQDKIDTRTLKGKFKYAGYMAGRAMGKFEIPQYHAVRVGVKEIFYDPLRTVERLATQTAEKLQAKYAALWKGASNQEKEMFTRYQFGRQGPEYEKAIKKAGLKPLSHQELSPKMQNVANVWEKDNQVFSANMRATMERHGETAPMIKGYFPLEMNEKIKFVDRGSTAHTPAASEAFFESLIKRKPPVNYLDYEFNPSKVLHEHFANYSKYIHMADETAKAKSLVTHPEFLRKFGKVTAQDLQDRLKMVTNPAPISPVAKFFERATVHTLLGLNPLTIAKQTISFIDIALTTKGYKFSVPQGLVSVAKELGSVLERVPDIAIHGHESGRISRITLGGIAATDRFVAKHNLARMLYPEIERLVGKNPEFYVVLKDAKLTEGKLVLALEKAGVNKKTYDITVRDISDRLDAAMGGVTALQRPTAYTSTAGRLFTILTSSMCSRFQYLIQTGVISVKTGDPAMTARLLTAAILSSYAEAAMTGLTPTPTTSKVGGAAASGVPLVGSLAFALSTHQGYSPAQFDGFNRMLKSLEMAYSDPKINNIALALTRSVELAGMPRQFGKTFAGVKAISEGKGDWRQVIKGKSYEKKSKT